MNGKAEAPPVGVHGQIEPTTLTGLTHEQVRERLRLGQVNNVGKAPTRTIADIVRANVLTRFNFLIGGLLAVILVVAPIQDALFGLVAIANTLIGIAQEVRAKRTLDRLAVLSAPRAKVLRDGEVHDVDIDAIVLDDVLLIGPGDQLVVDGQVLDASGLELNESLVTGESDSVPKQPGDRVLSGSFVDAGSGSVWATRVGRDSFAGRLTEEARQFTLVNSELRNHINRILQIITWILVPTAAILLFSQLAHTHDVRAALAGSVAGTIAMVPEGLVLLTSVAFAVAVVRLGQQNVLVQELPAVETLARVDVVCFDKTGTLTTGQVQVQDLEALPGALDVEAALGALAASDPQPNATLRAIGERFSDPDWIVSGTVPFSSARKWSGAAFEQQGTWVIGAPDVLMAMIRPDADLRVRLDEAVATGQRVVLLASSKAPLPGPDLPPSLQAQAIVILAEDIRSDAADTVAYFHEQEVRTLLISGDHPDTVASVARRVGLPRVEEPVTGEDLPEDPALLAELVEDRWIFGRVTPDHKRVLIHALQNRGHVVAMTGDGVNDVLALKDADIGIAMGNGAAATRAVAQLVLLDSSFATLPHIVAEGRRVIANIERVANLFLTKTVYATLLSLSVGAAQLPFPFLPRHLSLLGGLTIGIPAFFLALEPSKGRSRPGFLRRVFVFSVPAGGAAAVATFAAYWLAQTVETVTLEQARTTATVTLFGLGVIVLRLLSRPMNALRRTLVYGAVGAFLLVLALPGTRQFFALELPPVIVLLAAIGIVAVAAAIMETAAGLIDVGQQFVREEWQVPDELRTRARALQARLRRRIRRADGRRGS